MANRPQLIEYLGGKCAHCPRSIADMVARFGNVHRVFKFHHVNPAEKSEEYENLIRRELSSDQLDEVDKCILLCGDCHDVLHAQSINGTLMFTICLGDKTASQSLKGNFIIDAVDKTATFLTNVRLYLCPYWIRSSVEGTPGCVFGTELNDGLMIDLLGKMGRQGFIKLFDFRNGQQLFQAHFDESGGLMLQHDLRLNLPLELNPSPNNNESTKGWLRNGVALMSDGSVVTSGIISVTLETHGFLQPHGA